MRKNEKAKLSHFDSMFSLCRLNKKKVLSSIFLTCTHRAESTANSLNAATHPTQADLIDLCRLSDLSLRFSNKGTTK